MPTMVEPKVLKKDHHNHSQIVLNTPKQLNSIFYSQINDIYHYLTVCENDENTKFIVLRGSGRALCAGGDIKEFARTAKGNTPSELVDFHLAVFKTQQMFYTAATIKKPLICYMDGIVAGAGLGFALSSAFKIVTENTIVSSPECKIGHFCDATGSFALSRLDGFLGTYIALTSAQIKAEDIIFAGLGSHYVLSANLEPMREKISQLQEINYDTIDKTIKEFAVKIDHKSTQYTLYGEKLEIIDRCFKYDTVEEILAALKKEKSQFAQECLDAMYFNSPTSLKVTLAVYRYGKDKSLAECLDYEYRAWRTMPPAHDYQEGVKAVFEKRRPQWNPATIEEVQDFKSIYLSPVGLGPVHPSEVDFMISPYKRFLLPDTQRVQQIELEHNLKSDSEIVDWFINDSNQKFGVKEKVEDILKRRNRKIDNQQNTKTNEKLHISKL